MKIRTALFIKEIEIVIVYFINYNILFDIINHLKMKIWSGYKRV